MRFRWWAFFLLIAFGMCVQGTLAHILAIRGVRPDLLLVLSLSIGMRLGPVKGCQTGFIAGLAVDLMAGRSVGLGALSYSAGGFIAGSVTSGPLRESPAMYVVSGFAGSLSTYVLAYAMLTLLGFSGDLAKVFGGIVWPATLYDSLLTLPTYFIISRVLVYEGPTHVIEGA